MAEPGVIVLHRSEHYHVIIPSLSLESNKEKNHSYYRITQGTILLFLFVFYLLQIKTFRTRFEHYLYACENIQIRYQ